MKKDKPIDDNPKGLTKCTPYPARKILGIFPEPSWKVTILVCIILYIVINYWRMVR